MHPETRYALSGDVSIAYQVVGEGDVDLVYVPPFVSNMELAWQLSGMGSFLRALTSFARVIVFDRRGTGASDRGGGASVPLEDQLDDVRAVLEAAGAAEPALMSMSEGCALSLLYAATHPEAVRALVLVTPMPCLKKRLGYDWAMSEAERVAFAQDNLVHWGSESPANSWMVFIGDGDDERALGARYQRLAMGPHDAAAAMIAAGGIDVRSVLPTIQSPALVLRREDDELIDVRHSRYVAERLAGSRYVELPGSTPVWLGDPDGAAREIEDFLTGVRPPAPSERVLATVLFTDIVGSTERASEMGDAGWRALLGRHDGVVRDEVGAHRGRVVKSLGDGALAVFDGPSRALGCALALRDQLAALELPIRAGLHTGECELLPDGDVGGIAVHIGARIAALARPDEVLASRTVRDLSIGSSFALADRGEHGLKGVSEPWRIYAVSRSGEAG